MSNSSPVNPTPDATKARVQLQPRDHLVFIGDSITDSGRTSSAPPLGNGYVNLIAAELGSGGPRISNRGVSGDSSRDLLHRWTEDCLALAPDVVTILVGINDTWRRFDSGVTTPTATFETTYRALLDLTLSKERQPQVVLITPFLLAVQPDQEKWFDDLDPKIEVIRKLANEYGTVLIPADQLMVSAAGTSPEQLARDGVHPTMRGHQLLADAWLAALDGPSR